MLCRCGGHSHMSADIICLSIDVPFFDANLTLNDPVIHYSPHPMTSFFSSKFQRKISIFRKFRSRCENFINFQLKMASFHSNLTQYIPNDLLFWEVYTKKGPFFLPMTPFFYDIIHRMPPPPVFVLR